MPKSMIHKSAISSPDHSYELYMLMKRNRLAQTCMERTAYLETLEEKISKALKKAPKGTLRISKVKGSPLYFVRTDPKDTNGRYIPARRRDFAVKLAQKAYHIKALAAVRKESRAIQRFLKSYPDAPVEDIYDRLSPDRKKLVDPLTETDEMAVQKWNDVPQHAGAHYSLHHDFITARGERVRSKSEVLIADMLFRNNIPYRYEQPLYLDGLHTVHPDFTILNVRTRQEYLWEHNGMMDDPEYAAKAVKKINTYARNGYHAGENLILTYETAEEPLNMTLINEIAERYLL